MSFPVAGVFQKRKHYCWKSFSWRIKKSGCRFSFIMAVPLMCIACLYDLIKVAKYLSMGDFGILAVGFITSFVVAYVSILWFLKFLATSTLTGFAFYRFIVAFVALIYFW